MRNLKKILALVLALVMSLSLMATAGAGSFQDVTDDNPYKTAIDVLDELKVFQGFEDGSFKPTDTLNRAQAAVLVYRIATGDVEGKYIDNYTYMAQSKFNDLDGYNWAKGYINYCQNAGIVVGTSATTFAPGAKVTGYQLLVMLLRTLGYGKAGEFADPKGWELQTAAIAEREEITKNVTGGDFENPAPRQMVAEILFRGLLTETVEYSALVPGGYTKSGETLGKRELGLEDVKGVVMANEFADLEDDDTLAADKTRLVDADGKVYNLDIKSELTDIGEIRHAYVQNGTKVLTTLENLNDSTVNQPENGKGTKVKDLSKVNDDTQYFVNFGDLLEATKSEHRIEYLLLTRMSERRAYELVRDNGGVAWLDDGKGDHADNGKVDGDEDAIDAAAVKAVNGTPAWDGLDTDPDLYTYNKIIKVGEDITSTDIAYIKNIFHGSDSRDGVVSGREEYWGEVYVNTKSKLDDDDISDDISYNKFYEDYIGTELVKFTESDNGEWLKTIDNNGDGVADYVFLTTFTMSVVNDYNAKKDTYSVEFDGENKRDVDGEIAKSAIVGKSDLSAGEVILYTEIDGKVYVDEPETEQAAIDKKGINAKAQTITCDGEVKEWSGIEQEAYHLYHDVAEAQTEVNYTFYKDHFGYIRLYEESSKGIVLLTDGFYATDLKNEYTYKAEIYDDAAEKLAEVSVADPRTADRYNFIYDNINGNPSNREEGVWDRLKGFDVDYSDHVDKAAVNDEEARDYITSVAAYDVDSNSEYRLDQIGTITGRYNWRQHELDVGSFKDIKDKDLDITDNHTGDVGRNDTLNRINATDETLYYFVEYYADATDNGRRVNPKVDSVTTWTGYANATKDLDKDNDRAYAVTRAYRNAANTAWLNYETAEIIVIEHAIKAPETTVLPFSLNNRLTGTYKNEVTGTGFLPEGPDEFTGIAQYDNTLLSIDTSYGNDLAPIDISDLLLFYKIASDGSLNVIGENFKKYDIYAGVVETVRGTSTRKYGEIAVVDQWNENDEPDARPSIYGHDDVTLHDIERDSDNYYTIGYNRNAALKLDEALRVPGYQQSILYGNVTNTFSDNALDVTKMERGDLIIYIPGGYYINVTKSLTWTDDLGWVYPGVFEGDPHTYNTTTKVTTDYDTTEEWTLLDLWTLIAEDQCGSATTAKNPKITFEFAGEDAPVNAEGDEIALPADINIVKGTTIYNFTANDIEGYTVTAAPTKATKDNCLQLDDNGDGTWTIAVSGPVKIVLTYTAEELTATATSENAKITDIEIKPAPAPSALLSVSDVASDVNVGTKMLVTFKLVDETGTYSPVINIVDENGDPVKYTNLVKTTDGYSFNFFMPATDATVTIDATNKIPVTVTVDGVKENTTVNSYTVGGAAEDLKGVSVGTAPAGKVYALKSVTVNGETFDTAADLANVASIDETTGVITFVGVWTIDTEVVVEVVTKNAPIDVTFNVPNGLASVTVYAADDTKKETDLKSSKYKAEASTEVTLIVDPGTNGALTFYAVDEDGDIVDVTASVPTGGTDYTVTFTAGSKDLTLNIRTAEAVVEKDSGAVKENAVSGKKLDDYGTEDVESMGNKVITDEVLDISSDVGIVFDTTGKKVILDPNDVTVYSSWASMSAEDQQALNIWWFGAKAVLSADPESPLNAWEAMTAYGAANAGSAYAGFTKLAIVIVPVSNADDADSIFYIVTDKTVNANSRDTTRNLDGGWTVDLAPVAKIVAGE